MEPYILEPDPVVKTELKKIGKRHSVATFAGRRSPVQIMYPEVIITNAEAVSLIVVR